MVQAIKVKVEESPEPCSDVAQAEHIHGVFHVPALDSRVYVYATSPSAVLKATGTVAHVYHTKGAVRIADEEAARLKAMAQNVGRHGQPSQNIGPRWARFLRGFYKGDLAFILNVDADSDRVELALVPRIAYETDDSAKRKMRNHRPVRALFDPRRAIETFGEGSVVPLRNVDEGYRFGNQRFRRGLRMMSYLSTSAFEMVIPHPVDDEVIVFAGAGINVPANPDEVRLKPGNLVTITSGEQAGLWGTVANIVSDVAIVKLEPFNTTHGTIEVPTQNVTVRCRSGARPGVGGETASSLSEGKESLESSGLVEELAGQGRSGL